MVPKSPSLQRGEGFREGTFYAQKVAFSVLAYCQLAAKHVDTLRIKKTGDCASPVLMIALVLGHAMARSPVTRCDFNQFRIRFVVA